MESFSGEHRRPTELQAVTMRVRPDHALIDVTLSVEAETAALALSRLEPAYQRLDAGLRAAAPEASVVAFDFDVPHEPGKLASTPAKLTARVTVPLPTSATFWERARRVAMVDDALRAQLHETKKQKPVVELRRALPAYGVASPEAHRPALIERLHAHARSLGSIGEVLIKNAAVDPAVAQRGVGLDEVELSLPLKATAEVTLPPRG